MAIAYEKFIHPEDRAAQEKLRGVPLLDKFIGQYGKHFAGDALRAVNLATKVKVGPRQLPKLYSILADVCDILQIAVPEFYIDENSDRVSYACGVSSPFIVVDAETIDLLSAEELKVLVAHECGHILCQHGLYNMLADVVLGLKGGVPSAAGSILVTDAMKWALAYWLRKSEFSADRVAAFVMNDADVVARTMMRLAFGCAKITEEVNLGEFLDQAKEYSLIMNEAGVGSAIEENWMVKDLTSPYPAVRAAQVIEWFHHDDTVVDSTPEIDVKASRNECREGRVDGAKAALGKMGAYIKRSVRVPKNISKMISG